jgi:hypothetical protein
MSDSEILASVPNSHVLSERAEFSGSRNGYADVAVDPFIVNGDKFTVLFVLDDKTKHLKFISFSFDGRFPSTTYDGTTKLLTEKYGSPTTERSDADRKETIWRLKYTTIDITLTHFSFGDFLTLIYSPTVSGDATKF